MGKAKKKQPRDAKGRFLRAERSVSESISGPSTLETPFTPAAAPQAQVPLAPAATPLETQRSFLQVQSTAIRATNRDFLFGNRSGPQSDSFLTRQPSRSSTSSPEPSPVTDKIPSSPIPSPRVLSFRNPALPHHWQPSFQQSPAIEQGRNPEERSSPDSPSNSASGSPSSMAQAGPAHNQMRDEIPHQHQPGHVSPEEERPLSPEWRPPYSHADYLFDAAVIYAVEQSIGLGLLQELRPAMSSRVSRKVRQLMGDFTEKVRQDRVATARRSFTEPMSAVSSLQAYTTMVGRFLLGPTDVSPRPMQGADHRLTLERSPLSPQDARRQRLNMDAVRSPHYRPSRSPGHRRMQERGSPRRRHQGHESDTEVGSDRPRPRSQRRSREPVRASADRTTASARGSSIRLKPEMFKFNGSGVDAYISRIRHLAKTCGDDVVLANLSIGIVSDLESDGARWFMSLTEREREHLAVDLDLWEDKLRQRFREDRGDLMAKADEMSHSFRDEERLPLRKYIDDKIYLYNEAGEIDEDAQVRRIHAKLDPELRAAITLRAQRNKLEDFKQLVSRAEYNVRLKWRKNKDTEETQNREIQELREQLNALQKSSNGNRYSRPERFDRADRFDRPQRYDDQDRAPPTSYAYRGNRDQNYARNPGYPRSPGYSHDPPRDATPLTPRTIADKPPAGKTNYGASANRTDGQTYGMSDGPNRFARERQFRDRKPRTDAVQPAVKAFVTVADDASDELSPEVIEDIQQFHRHSEDSPGSGSDNLEPLREK